MIFLERKDIDSIKWNDCIAANSIDTIFCYTWYLDAIAENWGALISGDYETILPIPYTKKLGVKRYYQAPFTREYDIFGKAFNWEEAITFLSKDFAHFSFRNRKADLFEKAEIRSHQFIELDTDYTSAYRSNAKRLIKKGRKNFTFSTYTDPSFLIQLFNETVGHKIDAIGTKELDGLNVLMLKAIEINKGEMLIVKDHENKPVAGGFFLKDKQRITYLKGAALEDAKKNGAMYALFDFAFNRYKEKFTIFDFGGSDIENVATFYKKFGAIDRKYYNYTIDKTPFWFKALKKIKK